MPISRTDAEFRQAMNEKFERATTLDKFFMIAEFARTKARNAANETAVSDIFTESVRAEEVAGNNAMVAANTPLDAAKVRSDALKTLHDLMTDNSVALASRADIAKFIIESRRIG